MSQNWMCAYVKLILIAAHNSAYLERSDTGPKTSYHYSLSSRLLPPSANYADCIVPLTLHHTWCDCSTPPPPPPSSNQTSNPASIPSHTLAVSRLDSASVIFKAPWSLLLAPRREQAQPLIFPSPQRHTLKSNCPQLGKPPLASLATYDMRHEMLTQRALFCIDSNTKGTLSQQFVTHVAPPLGNV